jgi:hypothetical protein
MPPQGKSPGKPCSESMRSDSAVFMLPSRLQEVMSASIVLLPLHRRSLYPKEDISLPGGQHRGLKRLELVEEKKKGGKILFAVAN